MIDSPPAIVIPATAQCIERISARSGVPELVIFAMIKTEGGWEGLSRKNKNGTHDYGIMQINSIWLPAIRKRFGLTPSQVKNDGCSNIAAGVWILRRLWNADGTLYQAIGHYHSFNPSIEKTYQLRFLKNMDWVVLYLGKDLMYDQKR